MRSMKFLKEIEATVQRNERDSSKRFEKTLQRY